MFDEVKVHKLAKWLHDRYEKLSKEVGWETQERSRVPWSKLPAENKTVMIFLARDILELIDDHNKNFLQTR